MEMRLLTTDLERRIFVERLANARDQKLTHFSDVRCGEIDNSARLAASNLYGLFGHEADSAEEMIAGMAIHNLEMFPRTCPGPDLSHLADKSVFECSDHWSLSRGAGMHAWRGISVQVVRRNPRAVLIYLAAGRSDHSGFYTAMGFANAGTPVEYPYLEGPDRGRLWVQPMILEGDALARLTLNVHRLKIETADNYRIIRFDNSNRLRPATARFAPGIGEVAEARAQL